MDTQHGGTATPDPMVHTGDSASTLDASPARTSRRPLRILIVAARFPPENAIAALRPAAWAQFLAAHGHTVSVLTTAAAGAETDIGVERMCVPPPGVSFFARADRLAGAPVSAVPAAPRRTLARLLYWLRRERGVLCSARMPDHHDPWIPRALHRLRGRQWDVVLSTHGPYACHVVAWWLRRKGHASRWVADFRDLWSDNHIFPGLPPFSWVEPLIEHRLLRRADALTTVSEGLAATLGARHHRAVTVIRNGIDLGQLDALEPQPVWPDDGLFRIVYTGTIYASGQDPSPFFAAVRAMRAAGEPGSGRLRLVFAGKFQWGLEEQLLRAGLRDITEQPGHVPHARALRMQRDAGALLFLPFVSPTHEGILTGKLFEYLASGTPILSVGRARDASTASLIEASGAGKDYGGDVTAITAALRRMLAAPVTARRLDRATRERIDRRSSNAALLALIEGL